MSIDYKQVGITEPERDVWEFEVTQAHIDEIRRQHIHYNSDPPKEGQVEIFCSPAGALALQIFIMCGSFKPGLYRAAKYSQDWHRYRPKVTKSKVEEVEDETPVEYAF